MSWEDKKEIETVPKKNGIYLYTPNNDAIPATTLKIFMKKDSKPCRASKEHASYTHWSELASNAVWQAPESNMYNINPC